MNNDSEREAFEAWLGRESFTERSDSGKYVSAHVDAMWTAWIGRAAAPQPVVPQDEALRKFLAKGEGYVRVLFNEPPDAVRMVDVGGWIQYAAQMLRGSLSASPSPAVPAAQPQQEALQLAGVTAMPNPTPIDLVDPMFEAIWQATKSWDVNAPEYYEGYCGLNGSHVMLILNAVRAALAHPAAAREPLTHEQIAAEFDRMQRDDGASMVFDFRDFTHGARFAESHHAIGAGQEGESHD